MAVAVTTADIYDQFSGGQKDLYALRDFLQWFYERSFGSAHPLRFVCLLGDASRDFRNYLNTDPTAEIYDFVPTGSYGSHRRPFPSRRARPTPPTTSWSPSRWGHPVTTPDLPDLAVGRLPVRLPEPRRGGGGADPHLQPGSARRELAQHGGVRGGRPAPAVRP